MSIELEEVLEDNDKKDQKLVDQEEELEEKDGEIASLKAKVDEAAKLMQSLVGGGANKR